MSDGSTDRWCSVDYEWRWQRRLAVRIVGRRLCNDDRNASCLCSESAESGLEAEDKVLTLAGFAKHTCIDIRINHRPRW